MSPTDTAAQDSETSMGWAALPPGPRGRASVQLRLSPTLEFTWGPGELSVQPAGEPLGSEETPFEGATTEPLSVGPLPEFFPPPHPWCLQWLNPHRTGHFCSSLTKSR